MAFGNRPLDETGKQTRPTSSTWRGAAIGAAVGVLAYGASLVNGDAAPALTAYAIGQALGAIGGGALIGAVIGSWQRKPPNQADE